MVPAMPDQRPSLADHVALACRAEADKLGRPLTDEEHGCIRAGFHAGLLYQINREVDGSFARVAEGLAGLRGATVPTHELRGVRPAEQFTLEGV